MMNLLPVVQLCIHSCLLFNKSSPIMCNRTEPWQLGGRDIVADSKGYILLVALMPVQCEHCHKQLMKFQAVVETLPEIRVVVVAPYNENPRVIERYRQEFPRVAIGMESADERIWKKLSGSAHDHLIYDRFQAVVETLPEIRVVVVAPYNENPRVIERYRQEFPRVAIGMESADERIWKKLSGSAHDHLIYDRCGRLASVIRHPKSDTTKFEDTVRALKSAVSYAQCGWCQYDPPDLPLPQKSSPSSPSRKIKPPVINFTNFTSLGSRKEEHIFVKKKKNSAHQIKAVVHPPVKPGNGKESKTNDNRQQQNQRRIIIRPDKDLQRPSSSRSSKGWKPSTFLNRIHQNGSRQRSRTREQQQPQPQGQDYLQQQQEHQQRQRQQEEYQQQQRQEYRQPQEEYQQQQQQQQRQEQQRYQQEQEQRRYRERERIREEQRAELEKQRQQQEEQRRIQEQRRLLDEQRRLQEQQQQQQQQEQQRRIQEQQRRMQQQRKTEDELYTDDAAEPAEEQWRPLESPGQQTVQQGLFYYSVYRKY
ncbi:unnamed protein product [Gongylonema pulchrum]|uniref:SelP_N domain-containing protein n=1 Tax=Gongylonema pulchrum TaxID=637853 RepID=A0A183DTK4_9BILA|nr:unnamed protein product [Gongylonema pulchrum]